MLTQGLTVHHHQCHPVIRILLLSSFVRITAGVSATNNAVTTVREGQMFHASRANCSQQEISYFKAAFVACQDGAFAVNKVLAVLPGSAGPLASTKLSVTQFPIGGVVYLHCTSESIAAPRSLRTGIKWIAGYGDVMVLRSSNQNDTVLRNLFR